jgi:hypothetical protein
MDSSITRNVNDIAAEEKRALEGILGGPLASDQQVFIVAYRPDVLPPEDVRVEAKIRLETVIARNQAFAQEQSVSAAEADAAVAEAMDAIRRRS